MVQNWKFTQYLLELLESSLRQEFGRSVEIRPILDSSKKNTLSFDFFIISIFVVVCISMYVTGTLNVYSMV